MSSEHRILPPPPPSTRSQPESLGRNPSMETDFWAGLFLDLTVRVEWLGQALDAVPNESSSAASLVRMRSYTRALHELHQAIANVHAHRSNPKLKALFGLDGPLALYLSRLYAWSEMIGDDFERMAVALRRKEPTSIVFSHRAVNESYAQFDAVVVAMRTALESAKTMSSRADAASAVDWRAFEEHVEELIWASEWLHMTLARPPGE